MAADEAAAQGDGGAGEPEAIVGMEYFQRAAEQTVGPGAGRGREQAVDEMEAAAHDAVLVARGQDAALQPEELLLVGGEQVLVALFQREGARGAGGVFAVVVERAGEKHELPAAREAAGEEYDV